MLQATWHCCMFCNPANGRVDSEDGWLIKSSFITDQNQSEAGATFDNSFFDNSFLFPRQFKNRSFLDPVFVHVKVFLVQVRNN